MKLLTSLLCALLFTLPLHAEYFTIKSYDVQIKVSEDAYFDVIETILVEFTENRRGIFRSIPYRYVMNGETKKFDIKNIEVEGWKKKTTFSNGLLTIRIGDADVFVNGPQKYVIKYRVHDAFIWTDSHTEFYWNMIGTEWDVPIGEVAFAVEFPQSLNLNEDDFRVFTGSYGSVASNANNNSIAEINHKGKVVFGKTTKALKAKEGLTVAVKLPNSVVPKVSELKRFLQNNNLLGIPAALLALFTGFWFKLGKNKKVTSVEEDIYYPPQGYSPSEMGVLIDGKADNRDIICLLPYWAEQGFINIRNRPVDDTEGMDMRLDKLKDLPADAPDYQHSVFNKLFEKEDRVYLNEFSNVFYSTMGKARGQIKSVLRENELYDRSSYAIFHSGWMIAAFFICLVAGVLAMTIFSQVLTGFFMFLIGFIALVFHFLHPKLSDYGRDMTAQLKSFRETLKKPNRDLISKLLEKDPKYFEHVFPYAIALGLEDNWMKKTDGLFQTPLWYGYYGNDHYGNQNNFNTGNTSPSFQNFTEGFQPRAIQKVFTSVPVQTSTGGGSGGGGGFSGGGGSSGGGFGGGGGGSW